MLEYLLKFNANQNFTIMKNTRIVCLSILVTLISIQLNAQGYQYAVAGGSVNNHGNISPSSGTMLVGGSEAGADGEIPATEWFTAKADGGDYLVLRSGGTGSQASWVWSNFSGQLSSAAELSINTRSAANNSTVAQYIYDAEAIFIAGGDQTAYVDDWKNTEVETALNYVINVKGIPIGGTSAGMAILGGGYYAPASSGVLSSEILNNPYHSNTSNSIFYDDFLDVPYLANVITDTHLDRTHGSNNENRYGRAFGLLARTVADQNTTTRYGIACEEGTFVCIEANGIAKVFGDGGNTSYPTRAYFLQVNCNAPETIQTGSPLVWNQGGEAVKAYVIQGSDNGTGNSFDLNDWTTGTGGGWMNWFTFGGYSGFNYVNGSGATTGANPPGCSGGGGDPGDPPSYCPSEGQSTRYEYIDEVRLSNLTNVSGNDGGYGDYTNLTANVNAGSSYTLTIYPETSDQEIFIAWIDFNQDGIFDTSSEEVFFARTRRRARGTINIPSNALSGTTRIRISMKYSSDGEPTPCESFPYGEVEDYIINISGGAGGRIGTELNTSDTDVTIQAFPNPTQSLIKINRENSLITLYDLSGNKLKSILSNQMDIAEFPSGLYLLKVEADDEEKLIKIFKQ